MLMDSFTPISTYRQRLSPCASPESSRGSSCDSLLLHEDGISAELSPEMVALTLGIPLTEYNEIFAANIDNILNRHYLLASQAGPFSVTINLGLLLHLFTTSVAQVMKEVLRNNQCTDYYPNSAFDQLLEAYGSTWRKVITGKKINILGDVRDLDFRLNLTAFELGKKPDWQGIFNKIRDALMRTISTAALLTTGAAASYNCVHLQQGCFAGSEDGSCGPYAFYRLSMQPANQPQAPAIELEFWIIFADTRSFSSSNESLYLTLKRSALKDLAATIHSDTLQSLTTSAVQVPVQEALLDEYHKHISVPDIEKLGRLSALRVLRSCSKGYKIPHDSEQLKASLMRAILQRDPQETLQGLSKFIEQASTPYERLSLLILSCQITDLYWRERVCAVLAQIPEASLLLTKVIYWSLAEDGVSARQKLAWIGPWLQALQLPLGSSTLCWDAWNIPGQEAEALLINSGITEQPPLDIIEQLCGQLPSLKEIPTTRILLAGHLTALKNWCSSNSNSPHHHQLCALSRCLDTEICPEPMADAAEQATGYSITLEQHPWMEAWLADEPLQLDPEQLQNIDRAEAQMLFQEMWRTGRALTLTAGLEVLEHALLHQLTEDGRDNIEAMAWLMLATSGNRLPAQYALYHLIRAWRRVEKDTQELTADLELLLKSGCLAAMQIALPRKVADSNPQQALALLESSYKTTVWPHLSLSGLLLPPRSFIDVEVQHCTTLNTLAPILQLVLKRADTGDAASMPLAPFIWIAAQLLGIKSIKADDIFGNKKPWERALSALSKSKEHGYQPLFTALADLSELYPTQTISETCYLTLATLLSAPKHSRQLKALAAFMFVMTHKHQHWPASHTVLDDNLLNALFYLSECGADTSDINDLHALIPEIDRDYPEGSYNLIKSFASTGDMACVQHAWRRLEQRHQKAGLAHFYQAHRVSWITEPLPLSNVCFSQHCSASSDLSTRLSSLPDWPANDQELLAAISAAAASCFAVQQTYELLQQHPLQQQELHKQALESLLVERSIEEWHGHEQLYFELMKQRLEADSHLEPALIEKISEYHAQLVIHWSSAQPPASAWPTVMVEASARWIAHPEVGQFLAMTPASMEISTANGMLMLEILGNQHSRAIAYKQFLAQEPPFCPDLSLAKLRTSYLAEALLNNKFDTSWISTRLQDKQQLIEVALEWLYAHKAIKDGSHPENQSSCIENYLRQLRIDIDDNAINRATAVTLSLEVAVKHADWLDSNLYNDMHSSLSEVYELCLDRPNCQEMVKAIDRIFEHLLSPVSEEDTILASSTHAIVTALPPNFIADAASSGECLKQIRQLILATLDAMRGEHAWLDPTVDYSAAALTDAQAHYLIKAADRLRLDLSQLLLEWQTGTAPERIDRLRALLSCHQGGDNLEQLNKLCRMTPALLLVNTFLDSDARELCDVCMNIVNMPSGPAQDTLITEMLHTIAAMACSPPLRTSDGLLHLWRTICCEPSLAKVLPNEVLVNAGINFLGCALQESSPQNDSLNLLQHHVAQLLMQRFLQYIQPGPQDAPFHLHTAALLIERLQHRNSFFESRSWASIALQLMRRFDASAQNKLWAVHKLTQQLCLAFKRCPAGAGYSTTEQILSVLLDTRNANHCSKALQYLHQQSLSIAHIAIDMMEDQQMPGALESSDIRLLTSLLVGYTANMSSDYAGWRALIGFMVSAYPPIDERGRASWKRVLSPGLEYNDHFWHEGAQHWTLEQRIDLICAVEPCLSELLSLAPASRMLVGILGPVGWNTALIETIPQALKATSNSTKQLASFVTKCVATLGDNRQRALTLDDYLLAAICRYWDAQLKLSVKMPAWEVFVEALNCVSIDVSAFIDEKALMAHRLIMLPLVQSKLSLPKKKLQHQILSILNKITIIYSNNPNAYRWSRIAWSDLICPVLNKLQNCTVALSESTLQIHIMHILLESAIYQNLRNLTQPTSTLHQPLAVTLKNIISKSSHTQHKGSSLTDVLYSLTHLIHDTALSSQLIALLDALSRIISIKLDGQLQAADGRGSCSLNNESYFVTKLCAAFVSIKGYLDRSHVMDELAFTQLTPLHDFIKSEIEEHQPLLLEVERQECHDEQSWLNSVCAYHLLNFRDPSGNQLRLLELLQASKEYMHASAADELFVSGYHLLARSYIKAIPLENTEAYLTHLCEGFALMREQIADNDRANELLQLALGECLKHILCDIPGHLFAQHPQLIEESAHSTQVALQVRQLSWPVTGGLPMPGLANLSLPRLASEILERIEAPWPQNATAALERLELVCIIEAALSCYLCKQMPLCKMALEIIDIPATDSTTYTEALLRAVPVISASSFTVVSELEQRRRITRLNSVLRERLCNNNIEALFNTIQLILHPDCSIQDCWPGFCVLDWLLWLSCEAQLQGHHHEQIRALFSVAMQRSLDDLDTQSNSDNREIYLGVLLLATQCNRAIPLGKLNAIMNPSTETSLNFSDTTLTIASIVRRHSSRLADVDPARRSLLDELSALAQASIQNSPESSPSAAWLKEAQSSL